jgi:PAS domain S-box-containing protein
MRPAPEQESGDAERLRVLRATGLFDAPSVPSLDRLTTLAARLVGATVALVTLVEDDRQRFASACGLPVGFDRQRPMPLTHSYCRYVVEERKPLIVSDARLDERLRDSPAASPYHAIAYAGFPLRSPDGHVLGSFCVIDGQPREWTEAEVATVEDLAAAAEAEIALRLAHGEQLLTAARMQAVLDSAHDAFVSIDPDGTVTAWNAAAELLFGYSATETLGRRINNLIIPERYRAGHDAGMARMRATGQSRLAGQRLELAAMDRAGREFPVEMTLQVNLEGDRPEYHAFLHDITEREASLAELKRQRQELDDERTFLHTLLDNLDTGVAACDADGRLAFFNRAMREIHGQDASSSAGGETWAATYDLYGADGRTLLQPDEVPLARANAGQEVRGEQMMVRSSGGARRFVANARPIDTQDGRRLGSVVAMEDITELHRAEEMRRARLAVAQVLAEATYAEHAAIGAVAVITEELGWLCGEFWEVDEDRDHVARLSSHITSRRDLSDFTGDGPLMFARGEGLPGLVWDRGQEVWTNVAKDGVIVGWRTEVAARIGIRTGIGLPIRSGRRVTGVLVFFAEDDLPYDPDIAAMLDTVGAHLGRFVERRRAEDLDLALAAARRDFDRVVEQVNDYVWTIEVEPGQADRVIYASPNATGVLGGGSPGSGENARNIVEYCHPDDLARLTAFQATLRSGEPAELECRLIGLDGELRWVWTRAVPRIEGTHVFIDGISTNVTERRDLNEHREELLRQQQHQVDQLRELDRMKDELSALVIHELRNPVGVIRGYTELLLDSPHLDENDRRHAGVVERSTIHLQELVDDLLDLARLDAGHISIDPRPMSAGRLLRDVVENHRPSAYAKDLTVIEKLDPHLAVHADAQRLRQALDNLLSNAIKYTPAGGTVTVTAERTRETVTIGVADTGIGIPTEQYPHLFSRFFRASNASEKGIKGTGLGLAVTKAIIEAHHGKVAAGPAPDGGTVFTVTLPSSDC